jgi:hypothetical protein
MRRALSFIPVPEKGGDPAAHPRERLGSQRVRGAVLFTPGAPAFAGAAGIAYLRLDGAWRIGNGRAINAVSAKFSMAPARRNCD